MGWLIKLTQAILLLNNYFDMFSAGVPYTIVYTLFDVNTGDNNCHDNYGVFQSDQVTPKSLAPQSRICKPCRVVQQQRRLDLYPRHTELSIVGLPTSGFDFLLQKANGTWEIVVRNEPQIRTTLRMLKSRHRSRTSRLVSVQCSPLLTSMIQ